MSELVWKAIAIGLAGGIMPGSVTFMAAWNIIDHQRKGVSPAAKLLIATFFIEGIIGLTLIRLSQTMTIPPRVISGLTIAGGVVFVIMGIYMRQEQAMHDDTKKRTILTRWQGGLTLILNGPLYLMWIILCVPVAHHMTEYTSYAAPLFVLIYEITTLIGMCIAISILYAIHYHLIPARRQHHLFHAFALLMIAIGLKLLYDGVVFFL